MIPRDYKELIQRKIAYMDRQGLLLSKEVASYQSRILSELIKTLYADMDVVGGVIQNTTKNYRIMGEVDRVMREVEAMNAGAIGKSMGRTFTGIEKVTNTGFSLVLGSEAAEKIGKVGALAAQKMRLRVGYVQDRLVRGGFLDSVLGVEDITAQANNLITKSVAAQVKMKDMVVDLQKLILGDGTEGLMERKFNRLAFDVFQQYDAAYNKQIADDFEMKYFIYQGGLVEDSRDFCIEHNDRVWSVDEAKEWGTWTPAKALFLDEVKQKDPYKIPSYLDYPGYQPLIDRGGYNCRHVIAYISDELAYKMRPDLKE
jgi:hypothetical protein